MIPPTPPPPATAPLSGPVSWTAPDQAATAAVGSAGAASVAGRTATAAATRFGKRVTLAAPVTATSVPRGFLAAAAATVPSARLFGTGRDPLTAAADDIRSALLACDDAIEATAPHDVDLHEAFEYARTQLDLAARMTADTRIVDLARYTQLSPAQLGPQVELQDAPRLPETVTASREELFGLRATLSGALAFLADAVGRLGTTHRRDAPAAAVLPVVALVATAATRVTRLADVVVAHTVSAARPRPPELPGVGGDVELYAGGRATPYRRYAVAARVRFTPGRVEITTATGRVSIGQARSIGGLLWVAPGVRSAFELAMSPGEENAPVPELDELGVVHVLDDGGRSLVSLAVADWASQPSTVVDQTLVDSTAGDVPLGAARGIHALEALGFARGATTIGVPLRRGLAHPPDAERSLGLLRPAPQRIPYLGRDATAVRAARRRGKRRTTWDRDLGPTLPFSWFTRAVLPYLAALAPLVVWLGGGRHAFQVAWAVATLAVLLEPYLGWLWALARDVAMPARASARYRVGRSPVAPRLELRGRDLVMTSRSGHRTRLPGPADGDLGIVRIVRLRFQGATWGFALADARWRWRAVLPAHEWTPRGDLDALETFARNAGLALAEQETPPLPRLEQETAAPGAAASWRSFGPPAKGLCAAGVFVLPAALLAMLWGPSRSVWLAGVELALTFGGAAVLAGLARLRLGRSPSR